MNRTTLRLLLPAFFLAAGFGICHGSTAGNGTYVVNVVNSGWGRWNRRLHRDDDIFHPITLAYGPQNVLFGGNAPSSSWSTIHSFTSGTSYTQRRGQLLAGGAPAPLLLEDFAVPGQEAVPVGPAASRPTTRS